MIIRNIGNKIISIGPKVLMPDEQITVNDQMASLPALMAFEKMGFIVVINTTTEPEKPAKEDSKPEQATDGAITEEVTEKPARKRVAKAE